MAEEGRVRKRKSRWDVCEQPRGEALAGPGLASAVSSLPLQLIPPQINSSNPLAVTLAQGALNQPVLRPGVASTELGGAMVTSNSGARVFYPPALPSAAPPEGGMVVAPGGIGRVFIPPVDQPVRRDPSPPRAAAPAPASRKRRGFRETVEEPQPQQMPPPPVPHHRGGLLKDSPQQIPVIPPSMPPPTHTGSKAERASTCDFTTVPDSSGRSQCSCVNTDT